MRWLLLIATVYLLRDIATLSMPDIVFTGLCGMAFLFLSTGSAMGVYLFTTALTVPDFEIRIVYLVVLLVKFWLRNKKIKTSMLLVVLGMAALELLDMMLFSSQQIVGVLYTVAMRLTYCVLPLFWLSEDHTPEDYRRALLCYVAGVILGGSVVLYMSVDAVGWQVLLEGTDVRLGLNTTDGYETQSQIRTSYNANQLGCMFTIAIAIVVAMIDCGHIAKLRSKIWGILLAVYAVFMVFLTKSRTAVLLVFAIVLIYYFVLIFRRKKVLGGTEFLLVIVALIYGIMTWFPDVVADLMTRFQDESNLTGGRDRLFVKYMGAWVENAWVFLFGYGIGSFQEIISGSPHNILTDIVISWGLAGISLIVCNMVILYKRGCRDIRKDARLMAYLPALTAFAVGLAGQYLSTGYPHMRQCFLILAAMAFVEPAQQDDLPAQKR